LSFAQTQGFNIARRLKMKKTTAIQSILSASVLLGLVSAPAWAQVSAELDSAARAACMRSAEAKGFQVVDVVSVVPKPGVADGANVVLNLTQNGQAYKLTCGYTASAGALFDNQQTTGADTTGTTTATAPDMSRLWWLLLPLLGLPLLLWWAKGRDINEYSTVADTHYEGVIRHPGPVKVYSGPSTSYRVLDTLEDGHRVVLTGQQDNNWVELQGGGWIPVQYIDANARYVVQ
jgi:FlaG/FlaF family flagellin (archaellin)